MYEKKIKIDDEIIEAGLKEVERLNKKYKFENKKFHFLYRDRIYNEKQEQYLGWERKRGLITQFNRFLIYISSPYFLSIHYFNTFLQNMQYTLIIKTIFFSMTAQFYYTAF